MAHINLKELKELIDLISEKGFAEFEFEREGFRLRIVRFKEPPPEDPSPVTTLPVSAPSGGKSTSKGTPPVRETPSPQPPATAPEPPVEPEPALHIIKSPIVGTFYRSPAPTADPFVVAGDRIEVDSVVCIIEAMKLMNEIQSETSGIVDKIFVENGQPVEYGQPLFGIRT